MLPIPKSLSKKYEFYNYGHALEILSDAFPNEWQEIQDCLEKLVISVDDLIKAGGNERDAFLASSRRICRSGVPGSDGVG